MKNNKLFIFTTNKNKIIEIKKNLPKKLFKIIFLNNNYKIKAPKENGKTFKINAMIKSKFGYNIFKTPCVADDSGICINALNNGPGVHSNRFQKKIGGYKKAFNKIIKLTKQKNNYKAVFISVISYTYKKNKTVTFKGITRGFIINKPIGKRGFGYDPIFRPYNSKKTYGQMTKKEKNLVGHRGKALKKLLNYIKKIN